MPVRGTTEWRHAIVEKKVINLDHGGAKHVMCAWDDCENDGYEMYQVRINYGKAATPHVVKHVFCSERHRQYFINSTRSYGNLPAGMRHIL
jgi:hypothetical protein